MRPLPSVPNTPAGDLPIHAHREEIIETIRANRVTIIQGDTGSGKSTQLPKFCLAMGRGEKGIIGHTQPRRVAARSVASRVSEELGNAFKGTVGYKVRFTDRTGRDTRIKLMTDGILLAEIQGDRRLLAYDTLIIDEVHERSLTVDFILGYLKQLLPERPDLKVVLASATIDSERFSRHFDDAPVISVSGRSFPVTVCYWPPDRGRDGDDDGRKSAKDIPSAPEAAAEATAAVILEPARILRETSGAGAPQEFHTAQPAPRDPSSNPSSEEAPPGDVPRPIAPARDILVFLAGEQEIRETAGLLQKRRLPNTEILLLFGRLDAKLQDRIFAPHSARHVVLATNIAETSLTVPGIRFVIDAGTARISRYSHHAKLQRLPIEPISQASANQRKGRCGRVAPGVCIRLYSEEDFESRPAFTEPEIRRTNLATVILRMKALGFGDIEQFPFLDKPDRRYISDGLRLLRELGVLDKRERLNQRGRQLARLPVDPRIGRIILAGGEQNCLAETLIIASALSIPDPREFSREYGDGAREAAMEARSRFQDGRSDFMELLKIWAFYEEKRQELNSNQWKKRCRKHFLSYPRMREWREVHQQLLAQVREMGLSAGEEPASYARIHRALLTGLLGHVGYNSGEKSGGKGREKTANKTANKEYTGVRNIRFLIGRDSIVHSSRPRWVMAAELVQTNRTYAHNAAYIRPEWIERVGKPFMKTTWFDSHWDEARSEVMAYERLTLYGLTVIAQRKIPYASVNPQAARELFIESALVSGTMDTPHPNRQQTMDYQGMDYQGGHKRRKPARAALFASDAGDLDVAGTDKAMGTHEEAVAFLAHNRRLVSHLREMEQRSRRPDAFVDTATLYDFYDERIPDGISGVRSFDGWRKQAERADPGRLFLSAGNLCDPGMLSRIFSQFPDELILHERHFRLSYRFEPGEIMAQTMSGTGGRSTDTGMDGKADGVTVTLLQNALYQLRPEPFQWLVPGLLEEKILALLRGLPKPLRRTLPPVADVARACCTGAAARFMTPVETDPTGNTPTGDVRTPITRAVYPEIPLLEELGERIRRAARVAISPDVWREDRLPPYLRMNFRVIDARGKTLRMGRDLNKIQRELAPEAERILPRLSHDATADHGMGQDLGGFHRDGLRSWDFPDPPVSVEVEMGGMRFPGYPAIVDKGESVSLRLVDSSDKATELSRAGICRLLMLGLAREIRYLGKNLPDLRNLCLAYAALNKGKGDSVGLCGKMREELVQTIVERTFLDRKAPIRTRAAFEETQQKHKGELMTVANELCRLTGGILAEYRAAASLRAKLPRGMAPGSLADINHQMDRLIFVGFIRATPPERLPHLPRYLRAISRRLEKLARSPDRDRRLMEELIPLQQAHGALVAANLGEMTPDLERQRWLIEEFRVSLFAQELGTAEPVSAKRLQKQLGQ